MVFFTESPILNFIFEVLLPPAVIAAVLLRLMLSFHRRTFAAAMRLKALALKKQDGSDGGSDLSQSTLFSDLSAAVIVCGDIARSPRMQYHAMSLCESADFGTVHVVGSDMGNRCCEELENCKQNKKAVFWLVKEDASTSAKGQSQQQQQQKQSWAARVSKRVLSLFGVYYSAINKICQDPKLCVVLVQTPPVIPTLPIVFLVVTIENMKRAWKAFFNFGAAQQPASTSSSMSLSPPISIVFDVHNLGWTILKAEHRSNIFVQVYKFFETIFCRTGVFSDARITVAHALGDHLARNNKSSNVVVMPDSAPHFFRPSSRSEFHFGVLQPTPKIEFGAFGNNIPNWYFKESGGGGDVKQSNSNNNNSNLVIAASTSWTADDDYTVVVEALKKVNSVLTEKNNNSPNNGNSKKLLWLFVSGKGPSREIFEQAVRDAKLDSSTAAVTVTTGYFQSFSDYALFLGASDLGLCLHHSSSGLDLPMKGVDMLGAGLPVCALKYEPALKELVTEDSGWIFESSDDLAKVWLDLLSFDPETLKASRSKLEKARIQVQKNRKYWVTSWEENVVPLLVKLLKN